MKTYKEMIKELMESNNVSDSLRKHYKTMFYAEDVINVLNKLLNTEWDGWVEGVWEKAYKLSNKVR